VKSNATGAAMQNWLRASDADLLADGWQKRLTFLGGWACDQVPWQADLVEFDRADAAKTLRRLQAIDADMRDARDPETRLSFLHPPGWYSAGRAEGAAAKRADSHDTCLFRTAAGNFGILQFGEFRDNPPRVAIRYKLLRPSGTVLNRRTAAAVGETGPAASFGPVIEGVIPFGAPCEQHFFQFRSGKIFDIGHGPATTKEQFDQDRKRAADAGGVDVEAFGGTEGPQLAGEGCLFTQEHAPAWDKATPEAVADQLQRAMWITGVIETKTKDLPAIWLFKTARGEIGILQLLGVVGDESGQQAAGQQRHGLSIRYRLVQPGPPANSRP
jgi:hypothetical protein